MMRHVTVSSRSEPTALYVPRNRLVRVDTTHTGEQAVTRTAGYVRDQLGDARAVSLDSPRSRAPRIAALRAAA